MKYLRQFFRDEQYAFNGAMQAVNQWVILPVQEQAIEKLVMPVINRIGYPRNGLGIFMPVLDTVQKELS